MKSKILKSVSSIIMSAVLMLSISMPVKAKISFEKWGYEGRFATADVRGSGYFIGSYFFRADVGLKYNGAIYGNKRTGFSQTDGTAYTNWVSTDIIVNTSLMTFHYHVQYK
jgi:hypothetical protein